MHSTIRHKAEGTTCQQEQRNVVSDTADCVFKGRIVIDVSTYVFNTVCRKQIWCVDAVLCRLGVNFDVLV